MTVVAAQWLTLVEWLNVPVFAGLNPTECRCYFSRAIVTNMSPIGGLTILMFLQQ